MDSGNLYEPYTQGKHLGNGAFGVVFRVSKKDDKILYAMKQINLSKIDDEKD